ncbi:hypothetical protein BH10PSE11_BH10PSE11_07990 [soil metagenome]
MTDVPSPLVSVIMPFRNARQYLREAIDSVLRQTFKDFELLLIDDFSQDDSRSICESYATADSRVRLLRNENAGIIGALNFGIAHARGELIARMDADDICEPERFALQVQELQRSPAIAILGSAASLINQRGDVIGELSYATAPSEIYHELLQRSCIIHPSAMMRTGVVRRAGGYRSAFIRCEDYDLWLRIAEPANIANLKEPLLRYRVHEEQVTWAGFEQRMLSELCAVALAKRRRAGQPDDIDDSSPIDRDVLKELGITDEDVSRKILYGALGAATSALRLGQYRGARTALDLLARRRPMPFRIWLRSLALRLELAWRERRHRAGLT